MYLVGHAAVGMAITSALGITNPVAAFGVGWASHYLADFFPHGDEAVGEWTKRGNEVHRLLAVVAFDGALFLSVFTIFTAHRGFSFAMAAAALGSFVPDVLWGLEKLFKKKLFGFHERFHLVNHNFFHIRLPFFVGILFQTAITFALWHSLIGR